MSTSRNVYLVYGFRVPCDNADEAADHLRMYATGSACPPAWWLAAFFADRMGAPDLVTEW